MTEPCAEWIEHERENCECGVCGKEFTIIQYRKTVKMYDLCGTERRGFVIDFVPEKIRLLPFYPSKYVCEDCQQNIKGEILMYKLDRDAWWDSVYIFKDLKTFYEDFPGNWVREDGQYGDKHIFRILDNVFPSCPFPRFYSEDPRFFKAIQDMPIIKKGKK